MMSNQGNGNRHCRLSAKHDNATLIGEWVFRSADYAQRVVSAIARWNARVCDCPLDLGVRRGDEIDGAGAATWAGSVRVQGELDERRHAGYAHAKTR